MFLDQRIAQSMLALDMVTAIRRENPGLSTKKLYLLLKEPLQKSGIAMGRDRLHELLRTHPLLIRHTRSVPKTTHSNHLLRKYPNLIKGLSILETEQVWVCDMTYIYVGYDFNYLSLITDADLQRCPNLTNACHWGSHRVIIQRRLLVTVYINS